VAKAKDRRRNANAGENTVRQTESLQKSGLARWSRRKAMARGRQKSAPVPRRIEADTARTAAASALSLSEKTDADMPAIDSLKEDSDFAAFLSPKVSEKLRRMAMRKLFHLPQYNFRDELDAFNGDYTNFTPLGDIITADMRHHMERELIALKERLTAETDDKRVTEKTSDAAASQTPVSESNPAAALPKESDDEPTPKTQTPTMDKTKKG
jgi:hypothetical protein